MPSQQQKQSKLHQIKMTVLMFAAAILATAPILQLSVQSDLEAKPPQSTGSSKPPQSTGSSKPPQSTGSSKPPQSTGSSKPPQSTTTTGTTTTGTTTTGTTTTGTTTTGTTTTGTTTYTAPAPDNGKITLSTRIIGLKQNNKIDCTKKKNKNKCKVPKQRDAGKDWFKVQFTVANKGNTDLKNVKLNWSPSVLNFKKKGKKGQKLYVTTKSVTINQKSFKKGASVKYVATAQFKKGVKPGTAIKSEPTISAQSRTKKVKDNAAFSKKITATGKAKKSQEPNSKTKNIYITARVFNASFNKTQDGKFKLPTNLLNYDWKKDKNKPKDKRVFPYNTKNYRNISPGEQFTTQILINNTSGKALQNVKATWGPDNLVFDQANTQKQGTTVEPKKFTIKPFNLGKDKKKTFYVTTHFKGGAKDGSGPNPVPTVSAKIKGSAKGKGEVKDKVDAIRVKLVDKSQPPAANPLVVTKEVDNKNPALYAPFNYSIKVTNNSDKDQKVTFSDVNTNSLVQSFESFTIDGATGSTLKIDDFDKTAVDDGSDVDVDDSPSTDTTVAGLREAYIKKYQVLKKARENFKAVKKKVAKQQNAVDKANEIVAKRQNALKNAKNDKAKKAAQKALNQAKSALKEKQKDLNKKKATVKYVQKEQTFNKARKAAQAAKEAYNKAALADPNLTALQQALNQAQAALKQAREAEIAQKQQNINRINGNLTKRNSDLAAWNAVKDKIEKIPASKRTQQQKENLNKAKAAINKLNNAIATAKNNLKAAQSVNIEVKPAVVKAKAQFEAAKEALSSALGNLPDVDDESGDVDLSLEGDVTDEEVEAEVDETVVEVEQRLEGSFNIAAKATATIKLTAMITDDPDAANAITNSATVSIDGSPAVKSNETVISVCRTEACGEPTVPLPVNPNPDAPGNNVSGGGAAGPATIASTGPGAVAASIIGVSAIGYGARQWIASRRAMHEAMEGLYKAKK